MTAVRMALRRGMLPLLLALCVFLGGSTTTHAAGTTFTDPLNRFSFTVPDGWQAPMTHEGAFYQFTDTADTASLMISLQPKPDEGSLADLTQVFVGISALTMGYQADPSGVQDTMIGGVAAKTFAYTAPDDTGAPATNRIYLLIYKNEALYQITLIAPPDTMPAASTAAMSLLSSWQFT